MSTTSISKQAQGAKGFAIADLVPSAFCASHCNGKVCWKHNLKAFGIFFFFFFGNTYLSLRHNDYVRAAKSKATGWNGWYRRWMLPPLLLLTRGARPLRPAPPLLPQGALYSLASPLLQ